MEEVTSGSNGTPVLKTLPGDDLRQIMWGFAERFDLQMLVQSVRSVARGPVARLVAEGARNTHEWTDEKNQVLKAFDESGITSVFMTPEQGGYLDGPKNLALGLVAFELAWVDGGAATCSLATNLALAPIHEKGTDEQINRYMRLSVPGNPECGDTPWRGAFALTEPLPYVGVDTGVISGKIRIAEWKDGEEPMIQVEKRGRFITNMDFANFITAAVDSDDERIKSSCMIILEEEDEGTFDRGAPTRKLVHQLSSTRDPIFSLKVPASRIIGGYKIEDGVLIPNHSHSEVIEAVFRRTRVPVGLMTAAKLLSSVEPIIRYQRQRFRGGASAAEGTPRFDLGLQMKEDVVHRLVDVWATGEASASLGFAAVRLLDDFDPIERAKEAKFAEEGIKGARAQLKTLRKVEKRALQYLELKRQTPEERDEKLFQELQSDPLVEYLLLDSLSNVICPACKLWNTGHGATTMREAVSLMGGYGITEDCNGFLGQKWMDAQLEATYEGPEAVQRRQLSMTMNNEVFLTQFAQWINDMREVAAVRPGTGACTLASAMELWLNAIRHLQKSKDADGRALYQSSRQGVTFPLSDALCWLVAAREFILDVLKIEAEGPNSPTLAEGLEGIVQTYTDLSHVFTTRAAGEAGRICAELVYGYNRHPSWSADGSSCYRGDEVDELEGLIPGIGTQSRGTGDVIEDGQPVRSKAGPCVCVNGMDTFIRLRGKLDSCMTGSRLAKDRAASALTHVMIPETLDYPL